MLASNAPDIDIIASAWGSLVYLNYHRHFTHSLFFAPAMALLPLFVVRLVARKPMPWRGAYLVSLIGILSHDALDLANVYGVRLLLPFSARWFRLDLTSLIDPWIWVALLLAVIAPALSRLVGSEIGEQTRPGRTAAVLVLSFLLLYGSARAVIHQRALSILDSRIYDGSQARRVAAFPGPNPLIWRGLVEGPSSYTQFDVDIRQEFDPTQGRVFYLPEDGEALRIARQTPVFQDFLAFSQFPVWMVTPTAEPPNGIRVEMSDLRFGLPRHRFTATAILNAQMQVVRSWFEYL